MWVNQLSLSHTSSRFWLCSELVERVDMKRSAWLVAGSLSRRRFCPMAAVNIWKRLLTLLLTLKSIPEYNCNLKMSFVKIDENSDFSYHNLPYGVFSTPDNVSDSSWWLFTCLSPAVWKCVDCKLWRDTFIRIPNVYNLMYATLLSFWHESGSMCREVISYVFLRPFSPDIELVLLLEIRYWTWVWSSHSSMDPPCLRARMCSTR